MSWTKSRTIIRRLPLSKSRRLSTLSTIVSDVRQRTQLDPNDDSQFICSPFYPSSHNPRRRTGGTTIFFSTAPSTDFFEDQEQYDENRRDNRSFVTSTRTEVFREGSANGSYDQLTIDRIVSGGIGEYQSVDVDSVVTEDYLQRLVDDHISHNNIPPNPNMLLNMLELLHNEETHISNETVLKIFREVVRSKRVKLLERAEDVVVKNRYDPRLLRLLVTGYVNAGAPRRACKLLMEWPNESIQHQPGIESYRRVLTALAAQSGYKDDHDSHEMRSKGRNIQKRQGRQHPSNGNKKRHRRMVDHDHNDEIDPQKNYGLAYGLLRHMCRTHLKFPELALAPDRDCFHRVLGTCSSVESLPTAKEILEEMTRFEKIEVGTTAISPTRTEGTSIETPASIDTQPNASTIRLLVKVWTNGYNGNKNSVEMQTEAFEFLRRLEAEVLSPQRQQDLVTSTPTLSANIVDIKCYNVLLNRLAELGQFELVESMFRRLLTDYLKGEKSNIQPDMVTLNTVLKSHVEAHTEASAISAERFLERLDDFHLQQERIRKNKNIVIDSDYDDTPRVVYDIQPTARARSVVSNLWVKLGQPHRAIAILNKAESVYREKEQQLLRLQKQHDEMSHNYSVDTIKRFRPDHISYRQIIGGLCKLNDPPTVDLATKAEKIADQMCKMGHRLNLLTCNTILNCWAKSGNPDRAEIFLEDIMREHNVVPDTVSYNTIIHGYAQLGNLDRALELLTRLLEDTLSNSHETNNSEQRRSLYPRPNVRTFTNILIALSKQKTIKAAEEAEALLLRMQELNDPPYNLDTRPNSVTYNTVMNCWASLSLPSTRRQRRQFRKKKSDSSVDLNQSSDDTYHHQFGRKAEFVLRSMHGLGTNERPNAISYNTVIRAYSNDMNKAEELVQDMIAHGLKPTDHTYKTLVHVLNRDATVKDKDAKLDEIRKLYFASSSFAHDNTLSSTNDRRIKGKNNDDYSNKSRHPTRRFTDKKTLKQYHQP